MGWSSWSSTTGNVNATIIKAAADTVASKLRQSGYQYINIDDGCYNGFDANGRWKPDTNKFPEGIAGVATCAHSKGLKLGIYLTPAAPLYLGASLSNLDTADLAILTNSEVIAVDQAVVPARPVSTSGNQQVWYAKRGDGTFAVGLFNFDTGSAQVTARWSDIGAPGSVAVHDAVSHTDLGRMSTSFGAMLPGHGSRLLILTP